ncbi:RDD family protein [Aurantibacter crassamenti]|uniref:RDD family protein n=1 Tax=Aurantibacter crassamenti TaxID=1837375 RepID=UPI00193AB896|nr:RDD family protein [Aurantibacter crassamenti]MBM1108024.1 RDD family protein [Aurantibacter crassamenti]
MTRQAQLQFCKVCVNQEKDLSFGIVCSLNGQAANFESNCDSYREDSSRKARISANTAAKEINSQLASSGQRFANYIIDFICMLLFIVVFSFMLGVILALVSPESLSFFEGENKLLEYAIGIIAGIIYYSLLEGISGQSIGKVITKTKVGTETGEKPNFSTILLRSVCRYIPFEAFSFFGSDSIGWHDSISKTRVVVLSNKAQL